MIPRHLAIAVAVMFAVTIGMSVYILRTRRMVPTEPAAYAHPVDPPVEAPSEEVTVYVAHADIGAGGAASRIRGRDQLYRGAGGRHGPRRCRRGCGDIVILCRRGVRSACRGVAVTVCGLRSFAK